MQNTLVKTQVAPLPELVEGSLRLLGWLLLLLPTLALAAALPTVSRVKDINTTFNSSGSTPTNLVKVGNIAFFTAETPTTGRELWKSDGTAAGTVMVKDIYAGSGDSYPNSLTAVGTVLYFIANNGVTGYELWKSDGTAAGTVLVKDIKSGSDGSYPGYLTAVRSVLYFVANNGVNGSELWRSDGTAAGTVLVKDINAGSSSALGNYPNLTAVGNVLYFVANNGVTGEELWKSNGTATGTVLVKDIYAGSSSALDYSSSFTAVGNVLYFGANNGVTGSELWRSDGTAAGTVLVKDINAGSGNSYPYDLTDVGNLLYFRAYDGVHGYELWKSDGTAAGTVLVKDIRPGSDHSYPEYLTAVGTMLYFNAYDGVHGSELWRSDGTAAGTVLVKDINPGYNGSLNGDYGNRLIAIGNILYFVADNGVNGDELWRSDGTAVGTLMVKDTRPGGIGGLGYTSFDTIRIHYVYDLIAIGSDLYFTADNGINGAELWKSNGTIAGTTLIKDIYAGNSSASPYDLTAVESTLYFGVYGYGTELWKSNGIATGTTLVKDNFGYHYAKSTAVGPALYLGASSSGYGTELWKSNGTISNTVMVKDIYPGSGAGLEGTWQLDWDTYYYMYSDLLFIGSSLYFAANNGVNGVELWRSDGTAAGTVLVKDIYPGIRSSYPEYLTPMDNVLYFQAYDGVNGYELWKSDGTAAGTVLVKDIKDGSEGSYPGYLTTVGSVLYFSADNGVNGYELWRSNGTAVGTVLVKDINVGSGSAWEYTDPNFTAVGNMLYFRANNGVTGYELWKSNGTADGTVLVKDINLGNGGSYPYYFTAMGNMLYFRANNGINGYELWKSNGTAAGTIMLKDIWSGGGNANPYSFATVGNILYFQANNGVNGDELWQTDGTAAGTQMKELVPGSGGSAPENLTTVGTHLYFSAIDEVAGRELWRADIPNLLTVTPSANTGGFITSTVPQAVAPNGTLNFTVTPLPTYNRNPTVGGTCPLGSWSASAISASSVWTTGAITANCTVIFGFVSTLPDFVVTTITLNPTAPTANSTFTTTVTVKNQGAVSGDGKFLDVWNHQPINQNCGARGIQSQTIGTLAAGATKIVTFSGLNAGTSAGTKVFRTFVDSGCGTRESNDGNNQITKAYTVQ